MIIFNKYLAFAVKFLIAVFLFLSVDFFQFEHEWGVFVISQIISLTVAFAGMNVMKRLLRFRNEGGHLLSLTLLFWFMSDILLGFSWMIPFGEGSLFDNSENSFMFLTLLLSGSIFILVLAVSFVMLMLISVGNGGERPL